MQHPLFYLCCICVKATANQVPEQACIQLLEIRYPHVHACTRMQTHLHSYPFRGQHADVGAFMGHQKQNGLPSVAHSCGSSHAVHIPAGRVFFSCFISFLSNPFLRFVPCDAHTCRNIFQLFHFISHTSSLTPYPIIPTFHFFCSDLRCLHWAFVVREQTFSGACAHSGMRLNVLARTHYTHTHKLKQSKTMGGAWNAANVSRMR